jgi:hypothetical protein
MLDHGVVVFVAEPLDEPYGRFIVFLDIEGNRWICLGLHATEYWPALPWNVRATSPSADLQTVSTYLWS